MAINGLAVGEELRFTDLLGVTIATFNILKEDNVSVDMSKASIEVIVPIHGAPYLKFNNPVASQYTSGTLGLEGPQSAFDTIDSLVTVDGMQIVLLKIISSTLLQCVVTGVSVTKDVTKGTGWVTGQVSFIKV